MSKCIPVKYGYQARKALIEREGPPPFPNAVCRHLCENDSQAHGGFICSLHTTWGTQKENIYDMIERGSFKCISNHRQTSEQYAEYGRKCMTNPNFGGHKQIQCQYCGKVGMKNAMTRWHGENCKHKLKP
jgi:hypothetical protein